MNKDLKLLLISLTLFLITLSLLIFNAKVECNVIEYQDLNGTHTQQICKEK